MLPEDSECTDKIYLLILKRSSHFLIYLNVSSGEAEEAVVISWQAELEREALAQEERSHRRSVNEGLGSELVAIMHL
jgi:hypothetical protein